MTTGGTAAYRACTDLPPLVAAAVAVAERVGFDCSCLPEQGELLRLLAAGAGPGVIGETGTGCGVGLAWLATGAHQDARLTSVEHDSHRARAAAEIFAGDPRVRVRTGDWRHLFAYGPFDLLVLDGGGQGKAGEPPLEPAQWLRPGGLLVIDDFTPLTGWPPTFRGQPDTTRLHWLQHPRLCAAEIRLTPQAATIVATSLG
jgi:predicted O-methyltransferase YrrM